MSEFTQLVGKIVLVLEKNTCLSVKIQETYIDQEKK